MKLDDRTIAVLRNFSSINPSIQFKEGNVLRTISSGKSVMAKANLDVSFPQEFCIYDLSRFLGIVSMFNQPNFEFEEKRVVISSEGRKVSYTFADVSTIIVPPDRDINVDKYDVEFELGNEHFAEIQKAVGIMSFPDVCVTGEDGNILLRAVDTRNPSSDKYDIVVGETDLTFNAIFRTENLKFLPEKYNVSISSQGIASFASDDVTYWVSIESSSTF